ncbi:MAG: response regulator [Actinomycetota bacterium]|nr:response regulator [Actinomycetota bacterium]
MTPSKSLHQARVLIVDDESAIARMLVRIMQRSGYSCGSALSAQEAQELMRQQEYDVVVTDMDMPGGSGLDLISSLRRDYPNVATLMVTGLDDPLLAHAALEVGAYGYRSCPSRPKGERWNRLSQMRHYRASLRRCLSQMRHPS